MINKYCLLRSQSHPEQEVDRCTLFVRETFLVCATHYILKNVTSQEIIYPNPNLNPNLNPNQKNIKFGTRIPNPQIRILHSRKGRLFAGLVLGLGILDQALNLTQSGVFVKNDVHLSTNLHIYYQSLVIKIRHKQRAGGNIFSDVQVYLRVRSFSVELTGYKQLY